MALIERVVALVGGVGGAKLALGLAKALPPENLTIVVNTGDDFWHFGLRVCPDLDTVTYTLGDVVDPLNGWGRAGETTSMLEALKSYGQDTWFRLGDKDLATHILRTQWLREGCSLTEVVQTLTRALGIEHSILPMTNDDIATMVDTIEHGEISFQDYFVRYRWQPTVRALRFEGIDTATMTTAVRTALERADCILIAPSNPWLSVAPILAVPGMRETILAREVPRVAITPIVGGQALKGPTAKIMAELGYEVSTQSVAKYYGSVINGFVSDVQDDVFVMQNLCTVALNTIMTNEAEKIALAQKVLDWIGEWYL